MSPDNAFPLPPEGEARSSALADEVRALKALLAELQSEISPAVMSSLRERSSELQRLSGELDASLTHAAELQREVERWRGAALRGLDEISDRAHAAAERFEQREAELSQALSAVRDQLEASRAQAASASQARDAAMKDVERARRRSLSLKYKVLRREAVRLRMTRSLSWRITAPLRWIAQATHQLLLGLARLRRRLMKR
jgi:DNA repair exonuclease SbcCD ATPase subunit